MSNPVGNPQKYKYGREVHTRLDEETYAALAALAKAQGRSVSRMMVIAVKQMLGKERAKN